MSRLNLTPEQIDALQAYVMYTSQKQRAAALNVSENAFTALTAKAVKAARARNRLHAAVKAYQSGLFDEAELDKTIPVPMLEFEDLFENHRKIIWLAADGYENYAIAAKLKASDGLVAQYFRAIFDNTGYRDRNQAVFVCVRAKVPRVT
ncbi:MAG TPA: hypothetical protein VD907_04395 [Verrucomicrobiae bacterium]|nr:hypothetical protein [Verrucomicrobiae bacterium]